MSSRWEQKLARQKLSTVAQLKEQLELQSIALDLSRERVRRASDGGTFAQSAHVACRRCGFGMVRS